jgi:hypothetical protein
MKKITLILILISLNSCLGMLQQVGCFSPSEYEKNEAYKLFYSVSSTKKELYGDQGYQMFGCHYYPGDNVYYYKTIFRSGYILVRGHMPVTYFEEGFLTNSN